jgi:hypothetical protein
MMKLICFFGFGMNLSVCFVRFFFLFLLGLVFSIFGVFFVLCDLVYFIDWGIVMLNGSFVVMTFLFD